MTEQEQIQALQEEIARLKAEKERMSLAINNRERDFISCYEDCKTLEAENGQFRILMQYAIQRIDHASGIMFNHPDIYNARQDMAKALAKSSQRKCANCGKLIIANIHYKGDGLAGIYCTEDCINKAWERLETKSEGEQS